MTWFDRHPGKRLLGRYADDELDVEVRGSVYSHLVGCSRCRERVAYVQSLGEAAANLSHPRPPEELLDQILARRRDGERVILPSPDAIPEPRIPSPLRPLFATIAILVIGISALVLFAPQVTAGRSELTFEPALPEAGREVDVEYRPTAELAAEEDLRLRLRWRARGDDPPREGPLGRPIEVALVRDSDGLFRGAFLLPRRAVLLTASVEDLSGELVDSRGGRLWDMLVRDVDGRPALSALVQRYRVLEPRSGLAALDAAQEIADLYPESAEGWSLLLGAEQRALDDDASRSRLEFHRHRFGDLDRDHARSGEVAAEELSALVHYARRLGDEDALSRLESELERMYPRHPTAVQNRLLGYRAENGEDPLDWLEALEREWAAHGPVSEFLLREGVQAAVRSSVTGRIDMWTGRYVASGQDQMWLLRALAGTPDLADRRILVATAEVDRLSRVTDDDRRLVDSRSAASARLGDAERTARAALGRALLEDGRCFDGIAELQTAVGYGWSPGLFGSFGDALVECEATEKAIPYYAFVAVDPFTSADSAEVLRRRFEPGMRPGEWNALLASSRLQFRARMAELSVPGRLLSPGLPLSGPDGAEQRLAGILGGQATLLVFWDRIGGSSTEILEDLNGLADRADIELLVVTGEEPNAELAAYAAERVRFRLYHDTRGALAEQIGVFGAPLFFVVDASGQVIYHPDELEDALRALEALKQEMPPIV